MPSVFDVKEVQIALCACQFVPVNIVGRRGVPVTEAGEGRCQQPVPVSDFTTIDHKAKTPVNLANLQIDGVPVERVGHFARMPGVAGG